MDDATAAALNALNQALYRDRAAEWSAVRDKASELLQRTRDLRVAMPWCRANVNLEGFAGVPSALCLLQGLLDRHWEHLHPLPDPEDGDTFARISALGGLDKFDGLLGDVRQALLASDRRLGGLRVRGVEIALDRLAPRPDEATMSRGQIEAALKAFAGKFVWSGSKAAAKSKAAGA